MLEVHRTLGKSLMSDNNQNFYWKIGKRADEWYFTWQEIDLSMTDCRRQLWWENGRTEKEQFFWGTESGLWNLSLTNMSMFMHSLRKYTRKVLRKGASTLKSLDIAACIQILKNITEPILRTVWFILLGSFPDLNLRNILNPIFHQRYCLCFRIPCSICICM